MGSTTESKGQVVAEKSVSRLLIAGGEPIQGYRLNKKLGGGGSGQVWEAQGPGGFTLAQKFVCTDETLGVMEQRALDEVKHVRHPRLLSMFASWQVGRWLVIAMELAERTLSDRIRECKREGRDGLPLNEASRYLTDAAQGLDHLNASGIQHCDCKPSNLLLVGNSLKVGDFGLARVLRQRFIDHDGGFTPAFSPPEFFNGQVHLSSDQYSLAASYYFLRTGKTPFVGNLDQVRSGHLRGSPDLDIFLPDEREAIERAMSKNPADRWPDCQAFAKAVEVGLEIWGRRIPDSDAMSSMTVPTTCIEPKTTSLM